jgi:hypothetical protein
MFCVGLPSTGKFPESNKSLKLYALMRESNFGARNDVEVILAKLSHSRTIFHTQKNAFSPTICLRRAESIKYGTSVRKI